MDVISDFSRDSCIEAWEAKTNGSMLMNKRYGSESLNMEPHFKHICCLVKEKRKMGNRRKLEYMEIF